MLNHPRSSQSRLLVGSSAHGDQNQFGRSPSEHNCWTSPKAGYFVAEPKHSRALLICPFECSRQIRLGALMKSVDIDVAPQQVHTLSNSECQ